QAEDGIRDRNVTGVQTCALPILFLRLELIAASEHTMSTPRAVRKKTLPIVLDLRSFLRAALFCPLAAAGLASVDGFTGSGRARRSEERRVGKAWRRRRGAAVGRG